MLKVEQINVAYGQVQVLFDLSISVRGGEVLCLVGRNGAGKSTILKTIMGQLTPSAGRITFKGDALSDLPAHEVPKRGIGYIPQGRRLFPELTVSENIELGLMARKQGRDTREWVLDLFPRLRDRLKQQAGTLSGGEQQMLATARALCLRPKVLLLDEPTEGLQPSMIVLIRDVIRKMRDDGIGIILVEQRVDAILSIADHVAIIENGRCVKSLDRLELTESILKQHLSV